MARAMIERVLHAERFDTCFDMATENQYTRDLLFSTVFELMSQVVFKTFPSINSAYKFQDISVSITSVYNKLNGMDPNVCTTLLKDTAGDLSEIIALLKGQCAPLLPSYRVKMLDGNCIEATEHRLEVLRDKAAGALPGKSLVVYDPALEMAIDIFPCEDGHAQERSLLHQVQQTMQPMDVFIEDRNFCVRSHLFQTEDRGAYFVCRHHKQFNYDVEGEALWAAATETGEVYEQWIKVAEEDGGGNTAWRRWRCITVILDKDTRDGDRELVILTNLPKGVANAKKIAELYRKRWNIETMFQQLESHLHSEINTLGYPKAALFGFSIALIAYNIMAAVKAAMRSIHGEQKIDEEVSGYYISGEISRIQEGMDVAIEPEEWVAFQTITLQEFVKEIARFARNIQLERYKKHRRGPKKKQHPRSSSKNEPHVSTAKLLGLAKKSP